MLDVVVVGAGPAGSGAAAALAQRGWNVLLLERGRLPRHKVCGEFLSPEAQHSLRGLGLFKAVANLSPAALTGATLTTARQVSLSMPLPGAAWGLSRHAMDAALADAAAQCGAALQTAATVTHLSRHPEGVTLQFRCRGQTRTVRSRAALLACGRNRLPGLLSGGIAAATAAPKSGWRRCVGLKRHYAGVQMPPQVELFLFPGGYIGINPIEGGQANVCALVTYEAFNRAGKTVAGVIAAAAGQHPRLAGLLASTAPLPETECAVAPVDTGLSPRPWDGTACLGDAAAMIPPLCGDGMAMALRSAELCAPLADAFLRGRLSEGGWADAYRCVWRAEFGRRLWLGRRLQGLLSAPVVGDGLLWAGRWLPGLANAALAATRGPVAAELGR